MKQGFRSTDPPTEKGSFVKRFPDMTFDLAEAAFHEHILSAVQDTRLHPDYGLIADPKWDADTLSALFPFMVYEAKPLDRTRRFGGLDSWSDPDEVAWKQVTPAARLYPSLQESLIRVPGVR